MAVPVPKDKRFRRAHVTPARRAPWRDSWRRLARHAVVTAVILYGTYLGADLVLGSDAAMVTRITVDGNSRMSRGEVLALLEGLQGTSLVTADLNAWRDRLLASPWVADAAIRRVFPGTVSVAIAERQPLGIGRINHTLYLLDERGAIIDEFGPNYAELDLPIIDGLAAGNGAGGLLIDAPRAALVGRLLAELQRRPDLAKRISQIDVSDVRDAVVILKGDTVLLRVGDDRFAERVQSYLDLAPALRERVPDIDYVDLRFDERVYVRPQEAAPRGSTGG